MALLHSLKLKQREKGKERGKEAKTPLVSSPCTLPFTFGPLFLYSSIQFYSYFTTLGLSISRSLSPAAKKNNSMNSMADIDQGRVHSYPPVAPTNAVNSSFGISPLTFLVLIPILC